MNKIMMVGQEISHIIVAHASNQGFTITNGKRIIVDRLSINDFTLASIAVYGKG